MLGQDYHVETTYMYMNQVLYFTHRWLEVARLRPSHRRSVNA